MSEYTPTTDEVREGYAYYLNPRLMAEFDRWLAEVERAAAEKAWDEGFDAHEKDWEHHAESGWGDEDCLAVTFNPYRREEKGDE